MRRAAVGITRIVVAFYAGVCGVLFAFQRSLLFHPVPASGPAPRATLDVPGATLQISTRPLDGPRAILYFGGNAEDVSWTLPELAASFPDRAIYAPHYRGYGGSSGGPSEQALQADAAAVFDHVARTHSRIDVVGRSLGSAMAVRLAATRPVGRLVLVTPFDSILDMARRLFPILPVRLLLADRFESVKDAPRVTAPTLVVAAGADEVVPASHTRRLLAAFREGVAEEVWFPAAGHNDLSLDRAYLDTIRRFLDRPTP
jgi:pimeloyl-ACP methyl ester carboxylesterase